jgi:ubiquinone/menaquinone biosynthesis C-methylase UbiE
MKKIKCNLCHQDKTSFLFWGKDRLLKVNSLKFAVVKCKNCGLVYLNPQPTIEELKKYYPDDYPVYQSRKAFSFNPLYALLSKIKHKIIKPKKPEIFQNIKRKKIKFLDVGCGSGESLEKLRIEHPDWDFYGVDISKIACQKTKEKNFKIFQGELKDAKFPNNYFDTINLSHILEHLNNPKQTLQEARRILKPDGLIIINLPNIDSLTAKIFRSYWYALDTPRHLYHFSPKTIKIILKQTGFRITKINFSTSPKVFMRSLNYFFRKKNPFLLNPLLFKILKPLSILASKFGLTSIMSIHARKK